MPDLSRTEFLQYIGVLCIIAALVGGGLKASGYEIGVITSVKRQIALGAFGLVLIVWGPITTYMSEPRRLGRDISGDIESIAADVNSGAAEMKRTPRGQIDIVPLTKVYVRMQNERSTLGEELYTLLKKKLNLAIYAANGADVGKEWDDVNRAIASATDWP
jgi:hypothetical protein